MLPNIFIWAIPEDVQEDSEEITLELDDEAHRLQAGALRGYAEYRESAVYLDVKVPKQLDIKQPSLSEKIALKLQPGH